MRKDLLSIQGIDDITADRLGIKDIYDCMSEIEFLRAGNERLKKEIENIKFECAKEVFDIKTNFSEVIRSEYRSTLRLKIENKKYLRVFDYIDNDISQELINKFGYNTIVKVIDALYQDYLLEKEIKKQAELEGNTNESN